MDVKKKLVELLNGVQHYGTICTMSQMDDRYASITQVSNKEVAEWLIAHGVTVQEWISAKDERKPKVGEDVLVVVFDGYDTYTSTDCVMKNGDWCYNTGDYKVTHWQPIPKPPKGE